MAQSSLFFRGTVHDVFGQPLFGANVVWKIHSVLTPCAKCR